MKFYDNLTLLKIAHISVSSVLYDFDPYVMATICLCLVLFSQRAKRVGLVVMNKRQRWLLSGKARTQHCHFKSCSSLIQKSGTSSPAFHESVGGHHYSKDLRQGSLCLQLSAIHCSRRSIICSCCQNRFTSRCIAINLPGRALHREVKKRYSKQHFIHIQCLDNILAMKMILCLFPNLFCACITLK